MNKQFSKYELITLKTVLACYCKTLNLFEHAGEHYAAELTDLMCKVDKLISENEDD